MLIKYIELFLHYYHKISLVDLLLYHLEDQHIIFVEFFSVYFYYFHLPAVVYIDAYLDGAAVRACIRISDRAGSFVEDGDSASGDAAQVPQTRHRGHTHSRGHNYARRPLLDDNRGAATVSAV